MLKMTFVENNPLTDLELRLIRFVNSNIVDIINSIMDMISDGFDMAYYFPREYYRKNKKNCNEFIYDLRNTLNSHVIYESLTPLQSYVLFYIIKIWKPRYKISTSYNAWIYFIKYGIYFIWNNDF